MKEIGFNDCDFVSFDISKKLKKIGFNIPCLYGYVELGLDNCRIYNLYDSNYCKYLKEIFKHDFSNDIPLFDYNKMVDEITSLYGRDWLYRSEYDNSFDVVEHDVSILDECYSSPFIQQVLTWLRVIHKIHIHVYWIDDTVGFVCIVTLLDNNTEIYGSSMSLSYDDELEKGLLFVVDYMINMDYLK